MVIKYDIPVRWTREASVQLVPVQAHDAVAAELQVADAGLFSSFSARRVGQGGVGRLEMASSWTEDRPFW